MNILICDDMKREADKLAGLLGESGFDITLNIFQNGREAISHVCSGAAVDCCFLDIVMPDMDGIALAENLRAEGYAGDIVFLTSSNDYAQQSYTIKAFSYLIKPPTQDSVNAVLSDLEIAHKTADKNGISVKTPGVARFILYNSISHVEVIDHTVYIRLINGSEIPVYTKFSEIAPCLLKDSRFIQCHRSFIVNMNDIGSYTDREITTQSGVTIPISRGFAEVKNELLLWMFGGDKR